ncbi:MAG: hypothetical protein K0S04_2788 [Herbinix sp.]|jgi:nitrogenase molybdenum-iron protein alpha/beta subunit|nr:hypothetical protein [Herbinix sp.]
MPLYKIVPESSGRMGLLWTLGAIKDAAILEFGSMGHMLYAEKWMSQTGLQKRSRLLSTHLDEKDIALGIVKRLEQSVQELAKDREIKALFILPSSVPEMIGIDIEAVCDQLKEDYTHLPIISLGAGNFKATKSQGIEEALYQLAKHFPNKNDDSNPRAATQSGLRTYNLIGSICDMARFNSDAREIRRIMKGAFHMEAICTLTSDTGVEELKYMGEADVSLVLRKEGVKAAKELERTFGVPYYYGAPYGYEGTLGWIKELETLLGIQAESEFVQRELEEGRYALEACKMMLSYRRDKAKIWIVGNDDIKQGVSSFAYGELRFRPEQGAILMANATKVKQEKQAFGIEIERTTESYNYNRYESPFMGFRGAMKLCSLWLDYLMD